MKRRSFLALFAAGGAVALGGAWWLDRERRRGSDIAAEALVAPDGRPVFPEAYRRSLSAMVERLLPDAPDGMGARAAGAFDFIERELTSEEMQSGRRLLMRGAAQLERVSREVIGKPFAAAAPDEQDQVIRALEGGAGAMASFRPSDFLEMMMALTLEGLFGDPVHGGNKGEVGWKLAGYAMHPPRPSTCAHGEHCE